jgi:hypothetical protein
MSEYKDGELLVSITNPFLVIEIHETAPDGNVSVLASGLRINTTERYLTNNYERIPKSR